MKDHIHFNTHKFLKLSNTSANSMYRFEHTNHDVALIAKSLQTLFACA